MPRSSGWVHFFTTFVFSVITGMAGSAHAEDQALLARIAMLEGRVAQLQADQQKDWLTQRQAEEVRALIGEVLADADTRATLLQDQVYAGYDKGFYLRSAGDGYRLNVGLWMAFRHLYIHQNGSADDDRDGFEIARLRVLLSGHIHDPTLQYVVLTGHNRDGEALLLDAYLRKDLGERLYVLGGQFKVPFLREYLVSERMGQFVERSLLSAALSGGYTQGLLVGWKNDWLYLAGSFNDGTSAMNTTWDVDGVDYAVSGRADLKILGEWADYAAMESWIGSDPLLIVGGGVHHQAGESGTAAEEVDNLRWTVDASLGLGGANLYAAFVGDHRSGSGGSDRDRFGALLQGGVFLTPRWELIARYEWGDSDTAGEDDLGLATLGANYFFDQHRLKLTFDVGYAFNGVGASWASSTAGWRADAPGDDGQILVRSQVALFF